MKSGKKIFSFFFLILFLVSNTGIPFALHFCEMMNEVSTDSCDMCSSSQHHENSGLIISSHNFACCETKLAAEPIQDNYLSVKSTLNFYSADFLIMEPVIIITAGSYKFTEIPDTFPPGSEAHDLFLLNSTFLI